MTRSTAVTREFVGLDSTTAHRAGSGGHPCQGLYHRPEGRGTDITAALDYLNHVQRKRAVTFLVSDFRDAGFEKSLAVAGRRHDMIAVRVGDLREREIPSVGLLELEDPETGERLVVNTSDPRFRAGFRESSRSAREELDRTLRRGGGDVIDIETGEPYVRPLMRFFKERMRRRR